MKLIYERELFKKNILVDHNERENSFESLFSLANLFNIRVNRNREWTDREHVNLAETMIGSNVPYAFYRGFPETVKELSPDQLLFDQLLHYTRTYGFGDFSGSHGSVMEREFERIAFKELRNFQSFPNRKQLK